MVAKNFSNQGALRIRFSPKKNKTFEKNTVKAINNLAVSSKSH
jgi:hypothetical protein